MNFQSCFQLEATEFPGGALLNRKAVPSHGVPALYETDFQGSTLTPVFPFWRG